MAQASNPGLISSFIVGILSAFAFLAITWVTKGFLWPKYLANRYRGANLTGEWEGYYEGKSEPDAEVSLTQRGNTITGSSHLRRDTSGRKVDRRYSWKGRFLNTSVIFTFEDTKNPLMFGGAMVFYTSDSDANCLKGKSIYLKPELNDVKMITVELWKKGTRSS